MKVKDFFVLIIKLFGLYSIVTVLFNIIPKNISFVLLSPELTIIISLVIGMVITVALLLLLIAKADKIVSLFKLEKNFENDSFEFGNLTPVEIVKIATCIVGGFLIIHNLPILIYQSVEAFNSDIQSQSLTSTYKWNWFVNGLNVLIGYYIITNLNLIIRLLRLNAKKE